MQSYIFTYIYIYIYRERVIMVKKTTYLKNIFNSRLYQSMEFTFLLKPLHKVFFTIFTINFKQEVKILWEKIFSVNDNNQIKEKKTGHYSNVRMWQL